MPYNGSGVFSRVYSWVTEALSSPIEIAKLDTQEADFATGLSNCVLRDGTGVPTAATPWNGQNLTGVGNLTSTTATIGTLTLTNPLAVLQGGTGVTTSTGTGAVVLSTSPTLVTPLLGTPTSGNLANCTFPTLNQNTSGSSASCTGNAATATVAASCSGNSATATSATSATTATTATNCSRSISVSGTGLSGGGALSADRTITIDQTAMTTRNISAKAGVTKTLSSSAPSGGSDGDIWYKY